MPLPISSSVALRDRACVDTDVGFVLLAVDEPSIGRMLTGVFKRAGMNALWVGGLAPSLCWLRENPLGVTQVFVDCPGLREDTVDFCRNVLAVNPRLQVLLAGGAETEDTAASLSLYGSTVFIPKPYLPTELAWQLRTPVSTRAA